MSDEAKPEGDALTGFNEWWATRPAEVQADLDRLDEAQAAWDARDAEVDALRAEVERLKREYAELKDATWNVPGGSIVPGENDNMTHAETVRQAVDQSAAFETWEEAVVKANALRAVAGELVTALNRAVFELGRVNRAALVAEITGPLAKWHAVQSQ